MPGPALSGRRAIALAAALFAVTLNAFLPLALAVSMRTAWSNETAPDGAVARALWPALCLMTEPGGTDAGKTDRGGRAPSPDKVHKCCLGLTYAWALVDQGSVATRIEAVVTNHARPVGEQPPISSGIRDGPLQPRAPPFFV